jgi:hypothetical protein
MTKCASDGFSLAHPLAQTTCAINGFGLKGKTVGAGACATAFTRYKAIGALTAHNLKLGGDGE